MDDLASDLLEATGDPSELLRRELLAELREADQVGEADGDQLRIGQTDSTPALVGLVECVMAKLLAKVQR